MENVNPPPSRLVLPVALRAQLTQELQGLQKISAFIDSSLENTPLVSPFPQSDNDSDDEEFLNELSEYEDAGTLRRERIINSLDGDDLAFQCMIGFRKFMAYLDPFLPMNIISRKAYNTIMVDKLEGTGMNLIAIVRDVYIFVGSFTYITNFVVLEDIGEFIMSDMTNVLMGRPFRKITKLEYDIAKGLVSFTKVFDTYTYRMPRTIPRLKNFNWSKIPPLLELSQNDLINGFRHPYEKNKFMYKGCLNLGPEYQVDESMKEWLMRGHIGGGMFRDQALCRKAHLLEDKQIPSVGAFDEVYFAFGLHLDNLHMTWAHLEKKRTRLRTNTMILEDLSLQTLETASEAIQDAVAAHQVKASQDFTTASARADSKADLEHSSHDGVTPIKRRRRCDFPIYTNRI
ncbi:hypothetical protein Tco_0589118 [Tanacetum coccineum]